MLKPFCNRLRGFKSKVKGVATNMWSAYQTAVIRNLPNAFLVFDRYKIVELMNVKLTQRHRVLQAEQSFGNGRPGLRLPPRIAIAPHQRT